MNQSANTSIKQAIQTLYSQLVKALDFTPRLVQRQMIAAITNHLLAIKMDDHGQRCCDNPVCAVEAGTGTGKTLAYISACLPIAQALNKQMVIATATITLQEQIMARELLSVRNHGKFEFDFQLVKGRRRYICLIRLNQALQQNLQTITTPSLFAEPPMVHLIPRQQKLYTDMAQQLEHGNWDGDRDTWSTALTDTDWQPLITDHHACSNRHCSHFLKCPFFSARKNLNQAHCIVANHDLVLADLALGGGVILPEPASTIYIFDEGHHLASKTLEQFNSQLNIHQTICWLQQVQKILAQLPAVWADLEVARRYAETIKQHLKALETGLMSVQQLLNNNDFTHCNNDQEVVYFRFNQGQVPLQLQNLAAEMARHSDRLQRDLATLKYNLEFLLQDQSTIMAQNRITNFCSQLGMLAHTATKQQKLWHCYAHKDPVGEPPMSRWLQCRRSDDQTELELAASPILAATTLQQQLWQRCFAAVITSATLTALGRFDQLLMHTGIPPTSTLLALPSPFSFAKSTLRVPKEAVEPSADSDFSMALIQALQQHLRINEGSLVLFNSRRLMQKVFKGMAPDWQAVILQQGHASKQRLLLQHQQAIAAGQGSVLFGLASFAEGIDLTGQLLTHVVITRLPFSVPDRPVPAALAEWVDQTGGNSFNQLVVPEASLRLLQATGRLLRCETDQGRITVLDRRLISRAYGRAMLHALPPYRHHIEI